MGRRGFMTFLKSKSIGGKTKVTFLFPKLFMFSQAYIHIMPHINKSLDNHDRGQICSKLSQS